MKKILGLLGVLAAVLGVTSGASAQEIDRHGFTLQLSLGAGASTYIPSDSKQGDGETWGGLGGLNLQLGGFITKDFALTAKISGVNWGPFNTDSVDSGVAGFIGPSAQFWFGDHFAVEGGVGLGISVVETKGFTSNGITIDSEEQSTRGLGLDVGVRYFPFATSHHGLGLYADFAPTFTGDGPILTYQGGLVWQYY